MYFCWYKRNGRYYSSRLLEFPNKEQGVRLETLVWHILLSEEYWKVPLSELEKKYPCPESSESTDSPKNTITSK